MLPLARKKIWHNFVSVGLLLALGLLAVFVLQRRLLYAPQPALRDAPMLSLASDAGPVQASLRAMPGDSALIYFGGNAEDVTSTLPELAEAFPQHALYLLQYRGFGHNAGTPSEAALKRDALQLFDHVHKTHARVTLLGRSLGSGLAVYVASRRPVDKLVLVTPYDSIKNVAQELYPWLPVRWLLLDTYEAWRDAPKVSAPTLILRAENDTLIRRARTEALAAALPSAHTRSEVIPDADHFDCTVSPRYQTLVRAFVNDE